MIKPTVGRVVWYKADEVKQPQAAIISFVHSDRVVNLAVFDPQGRAYPRTSTILRQPEDERPEGVYCEWMPYQKGQAKKAEALEEKLHAKEAEE